MLYGRYNRQMNDFERVFWSGQSLEELYQQMQERPSVGLGAVFVAAMKEWKRSHEQNASSFLGMQQRMDKVLDVAISRESDTLEKRLGFLATVGSASPFIGLFGTVWGIMNAFTRIAAASSHQSDGRRRPHRRGAVRDGDRPPRGHPGGDRLQQALERREQADRPARRLCRRILDHPHPPARSPEPLTDGDGDGKRWRWRAASRTAQQDRSR